MKTKEHPIPTEAELITSINGSPFTITGPVETVQDLYAAAEAQYATRPAIPAVSHVQVPKTSETPKPEYIDLSTLEPREVLRRKISAKLYDLGHGSNLYGLFTEKLEDDRNLAMAQKLGIVTTVHCARHAKAVAKLRRLVD